MITLQLPWPHKDLSPNSRVHWATKSRKARVHRTAAYNLLLQARNQGKRVDYREFAKIVIGMTFIPPANRHYDLDGLISRMKSSLDGIADGLGVDDRRFSYGAISLEAAQKGGKVIVTISEAA